MLSSYDQMIAMFPDTIKIKEKNIRKIYRLRTLSDSLLYGPSSPSFNHPISEIYIDKETGLPLNGIYKIRRNLFIHRHLPFDKGVNIYDYRYPRTSASYRTETYEQTKFPFLSWGSISGRKQYNNFTINDLLKFGLSDSFWQKDIIIRCKRIIFSRKRHIVYSYKRVG